MSPGTARPSPSVTKTGHANDEVSAPNSQSWAVLAVHLAGAESLRRREQAASAGALAIPSVASCCRPSPPDLRTAGPRPPPGPCDPRARAQGSAIGIHDSGQQPAFESSGPGSGAAGVDDDVAGVVA